MLVGGYISIVIEYFTVRKWFDHIAPNSMVLFGAICKIRWIDMMGVATGYPFLWGERLSSPNQYLMSCALLSGVALSMIFTNSAVIGLELALDIA